MAIKKIVSLIHCFEHFAVLTHKNPDGDAIGSSLAFSLALERLGKSVIILCSEKLPKSYDFLGDFHRFKKTPPASSNFDCIIVLDCGDEERVDRLYKKIKKEGQIVINIDHHVSNNKWGDVNYIDTSASAVGEQIYKIIKRMGIIIDEKIATFLYFAILTDTGNFKFSNTTHKTFKIVSELTKTGINISSIYRKTYEEKEISWLRLLCVALNNLKSECNGDVLWSYITSDDFRNFPVHDVDMRDVIDLLRTIKNAKIVIMFKEYKKGEVKVSFRSKGDIDVNQLAKEFSGGGHKSAAGCTVKGSLDDVCRDVIEKVKENVYKFGIKC